MNPINLSTRDYSEEELSYIQQLIEEPEDTYSIEYEMQLRTAFDVFSKKGTPPSLEEELIQTFTMYCLEYELEEYEHLWEEAVYLDGRDGYASKIPDNIFKLKNLETLDLGFNAIREVSPQIGKLVNLKTLMLPSNRITHLPEELTQLKQLNELNLSANPLKNLPKSFVTMTQLEYLSFGDMKIDLTEIYPEVFHLKNLKKLSLSGNKLNAIPPQISALSKLETLFLSNNKIEHFPKEFYQLNTIEDIYLRGIPFSPEEVIKLDQAFGKKIYWG